jgi:hypothetical protein
MAARIFFRFRRGGPQGGFASLAHDAHGRIMSGLS